MIRGKVIVAQKKKQVWKKQVWIISILPKKIYVWESLGFPAISFFENKKRRIWSRDNNDNNDVTNNHRKSKYVTLLPLHSLGVVVWFHRILVLDQKKPRPPGDGDRPDYTSSDDQDGATTTTTSSNSRNDTFGGTQLEQGRTTTAT